jgi:hypothetical protein
MPQNGATLDAAAKLPNLIHAITAARMRPVLNILQWRYPESIDAYRTWLTNLLDLPAVKNGVWVFELGDEPNLNVYSETGGSWNGTKWVAPYVGYSPEEQPYGWDLPEQAVDHPGDPNDYIGDCPADPRALAPYKAAVKRYVDWLAASHDVIKRSKPDAKIVLGGLSSWQATCFLKVLGQPDVAAYDYVDAVGWHAYAVGSSDKLVQTPANGAASLDIATNAIDAWPQKRPVWITEYGVTTPTNYAHYDSGWGDAVQNEATKATFDAEEFTLLRTQKRFAGPVMLYTVVDYPLTASDWHGEDRTGNEGGAGLFEWCFPDASKYTCPSTLPLRVEPAFAAFAALDLPTTPKNALLQSQHFGAAPWSAHQATIQARTSVIAPDGTATAQFLAEDATKGLHYVVQNARLTPGKTYTASVYTKNSATRTLELVAYNPTDGTLADGYCLPKGASFSIGRGATADLGNEWYRCSVTFTPSVSGTAIQMFLQTTPGYAPDSAYAGDGTSGISLWGAQLEEGCSPTGYVRTSG